MRFTLWKKITAALGMGLAMMLLIGATGFWSVAQLANTFFWIDRTHQVLLDLEKLRVNILSIESVTNAHVLTGNERYFLARNSDQQVVYESLDDLRKPFDGNPVQTERLTHLNQLVVDMLDLIKQNDRLAAGKSEVLSGNILQISDKVGQIRLSIAQIENQERTLLDQHSADAQKLIDRTKIFIGLALICGLIFILTLFYFVRRDLIDRRRARLRLSAVNEQFLDLYNNAPCGYHSLDSEGVFTAINDTELKWLGYTRDEVVGKMRFGDVITPASLTVFINNFSPFKQSGQVSNLEFDLVHRDGSILTVAVSAAAVYDENGKYLSSRSTLHDVSDRKRAEQITQKLNTELEQKVRERTAQLQDSNTQLRKEIEERKKNEQAVREAEEFSRQVISCAHEGISVFDQNLRYRIFNPFMEELTTWKAQDVLGKTMEEMMPTEDAKDITVRLHRALQGESVYSGDLYIPASPYGPARWVSSKESPVLDAQGEIIGVISILNDISQRKQSEAAVLDAAEFMTQVIAGIETGISVFDRNLNYQAFNPFLEKLTGWKAADVMGKSVTTHRSPQQGEDVVARLKRALNGEIVYSGDILIEATPDRPEWWAHSRASPLHNSKGEIVGTIATVTDITERKHAEAIRAQMAAIVESSHDAIIGKDLNRIIMSWNKGAQRIFGYSESEIIGRSIMLLIPDDLRQEEEEIMARIRSGERTEHFETKRLKKDGSLIDVSITVSPIKNEAGEIVGASKVARDITERKNTEAKIVEMNATLERRIEERTQALDAKTKELESFCYSVSHDLKAPLRGIDGYSRLLLEDFSERLDEEGRKFLNNVRSATLQMTELIDDLLTYSRQERRSQVTACLDLLDLVKDQVQKREMDLKNIHLVLEVERVDVLADYESLTVAFRNLLDNAIKFSSRSDAPEIRVRTNMVGTHCLLSIQDNGVGFDMRFYTRIFEIFQRLHRAEDYPGTGIGLALVRKAMERMGGRVWAESAIGEGATFYLEIPLRDNLNESGKILSPGASI